MTTRHPTRRAVLATLTGAAAAVCCGDHLVGADPAPPSPPADPDPIEPIEVADGLSIRPRDEWGSDLPPTGPLVPEDVRFLLVHHSATSNEIPDPRNVIRAIYFFHTGPEKEWPDVAYNFFVDPDGAVWEGREGSIAGPVRGDATGGNQGFSQLVCLLGNHVEEPPTEEAQASLVRVLAWLAERHQLAVHADSNAVFTSRGSNKFDAGTTITTPTISAHRDVTITACPGDAAMALMPTWRRDVYDIVSAAWETDGLQRARRSSLHPPPL